MAHEASAYVLTRYSDLFNTTMVLVFAYCKTILLCALNIPEWYIINRDYRGVKYAKDKQVARCGNAVPPPFAEALVRANLPELCRDNFVAA